LFSLKRSAVQSQTSDCAKHVTGDYMKTLLTLTSLALMTFGCSKKQTPKYEKLPVSETQEKADSSFRQFANFPTIKDPVKFIADLRQIFRLEVDESPSQIEYEKITTFIK
jgi:PBP1b-binding outer membrane lipoprotein LpoB